MDCPKTYVKRSRIPQAGYGVFASRDIQPGELLETAPFIELPAQIVYGGMDNLLKNYVFASHMKPKHVLVVFGNGSMYNCSKQPNAQYLVNDKNPERFMDYVAILPIKQGEEILINYNRTPI